MNTGGKPILVFLALGLLGLCACSSNVRPTAAGEDPEVPLAEARDEVRAITRQTLVDLYAVQSGAERAIESAAGYAVFSNFGLKILVAGGGSGSGLVVDNDDGREVFMRMAEVQAGLGFGIKNFRQVWVFHDRQALTNFVDQGFEFGGQATLAATTGGRGAEFAGAISVSPGVWVYQLTDDGLAAELTVKGTRYYRDRELN